MPHPTLPDYAAASCYGLRGWLAWLDEAEQAFGAAFDDDERAPPDALDGAVAAFLAGDTPQAFADALAGERT